MKDSNDQTGTIPASGSKVLSGLTLDIPATITLSSSDAGRKIELSTDGVTYFTPTYDVTAANMINVSLLAPIRTFKLTGAVNDAWNVL